MDCTAKPVPAVVIVVIIVVVVGFVFGGCTAEIFAPGPDAALGGGSSSTWLVGGPPTGCLRSMFPGAGGNSPWDSIRRD